MQRLEKEINTSNKKSMVKRYKMYQEKISEVLGKSKNDTKRGEKSNGI